MNVKPKMKRNPPNKKTQPKSTPKQRGDWAEELAAYWLERHGGQILERNYRCRRGEIDLIARFDETIAFVEVRARRGSSPYEAIASVRPKKQRRIQYAARHYLAQHEACDSLLRFDIIGLSHDHDENQRLAWIRAAFAGSTL